MEKHKETGLTNVPALLKVDLSKTIHLKRPQREVRKEERNDFPRHRRDLEVKFNLGEIYSHQMD